LEIRLPAKILKKPLAKSGIIESQKYANHQASFKSDGKGEPA
jgi:hypothetical protein